LGNFPARVCLTTRRGSATHLDLEHLLLLHSISLYHCIPGRWCCHRLPRTLQIQCVDLRPRQGSTPLCLLLVEFRSIRL
jgi:hypothetical protein